jgi:hypothetical protein
MEKEHDKEWTKVQNVHFQNEGRECGVQGEDMANEITCWKIEGVEENG